MKDRLVKKHLLSIVIALVLCTLTGCKQLKQIYDTLKTGARCTTPLTCLDGACLTEKEGFPGGMCTGEPCEQRGCLSLFVECFPTELASRGETSICLPTCNKGRTCEREAEGYECRVLNDTFVCVPPGALKTSVPGVTGAACTLASECHGNDALCLTTMDNGYCSQECTFGGSDCLNQEPCLHSDPSNLSSKTLCFKSCRSDDDCRFGYECRSQEGRNICLPSPTAKVRNPKGKEDGEPCRSNLNCKGDACIRANGGESGGGANPPYPGGYCTTRHCNTDSDCNGSHSKCVSRGRTTACFAGCSRDSDCRSGYQCVETPQGKVCDSNTPLPDVKPDKSGPLQVKCTTGDIRFDIPNGAIGFYAAPFTEDGQRVIPTRLTRSDGGVNLNIQSQYAFGAVNPDILGAMAPMLFPASNKNEFKNAFGSGSYTMKVQSRANRVCYYVIPKMQEGNRIRVKLYFVGLRGINARNAASNSDIQALIRRMQDIYQQMHIDVEVAGYEDVSSSIASRYRIIRNFNDVFSLVATSRDEGSTLNSNLVVNVFLIQDFAISESPGLLGVSTGIPGMAGMGGTIGSGLVFTTTALGSNNKQLGQTMAHEIGHFLGLRHTTEHGGSSHDPITDTGECLTPKLQYACPDATNFMFAFAMGPDQTKATPGQEFVVRRSPLVQ